MAKKYLTINKRVDDFDVYMLDGDINDAISYLGYLKDRYTEGHLYISIEFDISGNNQSCLVLQRQETDDERSKRLQRATLEKQRKQQKKQQYKQKLIKETQKLIRRHKITSEELFNE